MRRILLLFALVLGLVASVVGQVPLTFGRAATIFTQSNPIRVLEGLMFQGALPVTQTLHGANAGTRQPLGGEEMVLCNYTGSGAIQYVKWITNDTGHPKFEFRIYVDGEFFPSAKFETGTQWGSYGLSITSTIQAYQTEHFGFANTSNSAQQGIYWLRFPIPYSNGCRITVYNPDLTDTTGLGLWAQVNSIPSVASAYRLRSSKLRSFAAPATAAVGSDLTFASNPTGQGYIASTSYISWDAGGANSGHELERDFDFYSAYSAATPAKLGTGTEDYFDGGFYQFPNWPWGYATPNSMSGGSGGKYFGTVANKDLLNQYGGFAYSNGFKIVLPAETAANIASSHTGSTLYYEKIGSGPTYPKESGPFTPADLPSGLTAYWDMNLGRWNNLADPGAPAIYARPGTTVGLVKDLSGNGNDMRMATTANRPQLTDCPDGGLTALTTQPGIAQYLSLATPEGIALADADIMFIGSIQWGVDTRGIIADNVGGGDPHQANLRVNGGGIMSWYASDGTTFFSTASYTTAGLDQGQPAIFEWVRSGTTMQFYVNGIKIGADVTGNTTTLKLDTLDRWGGVATPPVLRRATLVWPRALSTPERAAAIAKLQTRYLVPDTGLAPDYRHKLRRIYSAWGQASVAAQGGVDLGFLGDSLQDGAATSTPHYNNIAHLVAVKAQPAINPSGVQGGFGLRKSVWSTSYTSSSWPVVAALSTFPYIVNAESGVTNNQGYGFAFTSTPYNAANNYRCRWEFNGADTNLTHREQVSDVDYLMSNSCKTTFDIGTTTGFMNRGAGTTSVSVAANSATGFRGNASLATFTPTNLNVVQYSPASDATNAISSNVFVHGVILYDGDTNTGVRCHNWGRGAVQTSDIDSNALSLLHSFMTATNVATSSWARNTKFINIDILTNDELNAIPVATFQTRLAAIIDDLLSQPSAPCILVSFHPAPPTGLANFNTSLYPTAAAGWAAYIAAAKTVIAARDNVTYLDFWANRQNSDSNDPVWGANTWGFVHSDLLHATDDANNFYATKIWAAIRP